MNTWRAFPDAVALRRVVRLPQDHRTGLGISVNDLRSLEWHRLKLCRYERSPSRLSADDGHIRLLGIVVGSCCILSPESRGRPIRLNSFAAASACRRPLRSEIRWWPVAVRRTPARRSCCRYAAIELEVRVGHVLEDDGAPQKTQSDENRYVRSCRRAACSSDRCSDRASRLPRAQARRPRNASRRRTPPRPRSPPTRSPPGRNRRPLPS